MSTTHSHSPAHQYVRCTCPAGVDGHYDLDYLADQMEPYGGYAWDRSLDEARARYARAVTTRERAITVRWFLNKWLTRIGMSSASTTMFASSYGAWLEAVTPLLGTKPALALLSNDEIEVFGDLFEDLSTRPGAVDKRGTVRTVGPTGAAKVLLLLFGESVPAWDQGIRDRFVGGNSSRTAYVSYLHKMRSAAQCLEAQLASSISTAPSVGAYVNRAPASTAYILDTAAYRNL